MVIFIHKSEKQPLFPINIKNKCLTAVSTCFLRLF